MAKELLVEGEKTFKITIPDDAKITFGPWSPPPKNKAWGHDDRIGTLRIYQGTKDNIIACFAGVRTFRILTMGYREQVAKEEGATMWKDDEKGYVREDKVSIKNEWVTPQLEGEVLEIRKKNKKK